MRLLFLLLLCLLSTPLYAFDACNEQDRTAYEPIAERAPKALLYSLQKCKAPTSYLFGTYHADSKRIKDIAAPALQSLKHVEVAAFEVLFDAKTQIAMQQELMLPADHAGLQSIVGRGLFQQSVEAVRTLGAPVPIDIIDRFKPWALAVLIQYPQPEEDGVVLDQKLQQIAKQAGVRLVPLEKVEERFTFFDNIPKRKQIEFLRESIEKKDESKEVQEELERSYLARDLTELFAISRRVLQDMDDPELSKQLEYALITERNNIMVRRSAPILPYYSTLIAVGALHLPGPAGMLTQFERLGFYLFPVDAQ